MVRKALAALILLGTASCVVDRGSPQALAKFGFDPNAVYRVSSFAGATSAYCPVRPDKSFVLCDGAENYVFSSNDFNGDSVTLRDGDDVFVLERAAFTKAGTFALVSSSSGYGSNFTFTVPKTASFTFDIAGPGTVLTGGPDDIRPKLERVMRRKFGAAADGLTYIRSARVAVECGPRVPITNNITTCTVTGDAPFGSTIQTVQ